MPRGKPKKQPVISQKLNNFEDFIQSYDYQTLVGALASFEASTGWDLFKAYLYRSAAFQARQAIVYAQEDGWAVRSSSAAAKAEILQQVADQFVAEVRNTVLNKSAAVMNPPVDPEVVDHPPVE